MKIKEKRINKWKKKEKEKASPKNKTKTVFNNHLLSSLSYIKQSFIFVKKKKSIKQLSVPKL